MGPKYDPNRRIIEEDFKHKTEYFILETAASINITFTVYNGLEDDLVKAIDFHVYANKQGVT